MATESKFSICLTDIPMNTPSNDAIYISGNFNNWQTNNEDFRMVVDEHGIYHVIINKIPGETIEFKFTRGSWNTVECDYNGNDLPDHHLSISNEAVCFFTKVQTWKDLCDEDERVTPGVSIFEHNYFIPQLNRYRRVWMYLPPDYRSNTSSHYPVLYMQDGQNLFKWGISSVNGKWNIDHSLNKLFSHGMPGIIVIGIDNGGNNRIDEYSPWVNPKQGGGQGQEYIEFISGTLKPDIDQRLRTAADRDNTAIMGSSMGGLISLYAILAKQDIFGKAGIFSPSLWFTDEIFAFTAQTEKQYSVKIALLGGEQESESMMNDLLALYNTLRDAGFGEDELHLDFYRDGVHQEWFWEREFGHALMWLFGSEEMQHDEEDLLTIKIVRNGVAKLYFSNPYSGLAKLCLINSYGKMVWQQETSATKQHFHLPTQLSGNMIAKAVLNNGKYLFKKVKL